MRHVAIVVTIGLVVLWSQTAASLTVEELLRLKKAGIGDETLHLYIQLELERTRSHSLGRTMGQKTIVAPDGNKRIIRYSIEDPDQVLEDHLKAEELEQRSWDILRNLILDARGAKWEGDDGYSRPASGGFSPSDNP